MRFSTHFANEKYAQLLDYIRTLKSGEGISPSRIQRELRVGYKLAEEFLQALHQEGYVESYQKWAGSYWNGERKDGKYITFYRIPISSNKSQEDKRK
jgi:Mn-dependent DtxR family transcriptional regulator